MARLAVTGASGFIGRAITAALIDAGHTVTALVRRPEAAGEVRALGAAPILGGLDQPERLAALCARATAVIHVAGVTRGIDYADFERVNVAGSAAVFAAARRAGLPVLAISSLAARAPDISHYALSKRAMERLLDGAAAPRSLVLRPPAVYGPGDTEIAPLFAAMRRGVAVTPGRTNARFSMLHVQDLAEAVCAWVEQGLAATGIHELDDGAARGHDWNEIIAEASALLGHRVRRIGIPGRALGWAGAVNAAAARRLGYAPMLTPAKVAELTQPDWVADTASLSGVLDWQPRITLSAGLAQMLGTHVFDKESIDEQSLRRDLHPSGPASQAHGGRVGDDHPVRAPGGRSGPGLGAGHGSDDGAGGPHGHLDSAELPARRADDGSAGTRAGGGHRPVSLFDKFAPIADVRRQMRDAGIEPLAVPMERVLSSTEAVIRGKRTILAGSNNYLGLTFDEDCVEASVAAVRNQGTGTTGSRMANGSYDGHLALEAELAAFYDMPQALVFSTGYQANLGMLSTLVGPKDTVMLDGDCHASIYDGLRLGGAKTLRFKHNDPQDLDKRLGRLGEAAQHTLVVVEGIYSMLGDAAPLAEIVGVVKKHGAYILVDEAHSMGICGAHGRGVVEAEGVLGAVDFIVGTFSKSLGSAGGFCVSPHADLDMIRYASRPYIFTASMVPSVIASTRAALQRLATDDTLRDRIWANANRLHAGLANLGFTIAAEPGPVVACVFDSREAALGMWQGLLDRGVYVNLMLPPATPNGQCLVRTSLSAGHSTTQIETLIAAFGETALALKKHAAAAAE